MLNAWPFGFIFYMEANIIDTDPFGIDKLDPKSKKIFGLMLVISGVLNSDYTVLKKWREAYKDEWAFDEYVYIITKKLMEMSEDDFTKFQTDYREKIRQRGQDSDKQSHSDDEKGSGEDNENLFHEDNDSNH